MVGGNVDPILGVLLQTGALGVVVYMLITQLTAAIKELTSEMKATNTDIKVLLDRNVRGMEQIATEAARSRDIVTEAVRRESQSVRETVQQLPQAPHE